MDLRGVRVVLVNAFEDYADRGGDADLRRLLAELGAPWPVVGDTGALRRRFDVRRIPALFAYGPDGRLRARWRGRDARPSASVLRSHLSSP